MPKGNSLEVGVIGAGTAGLATAIALARAGHAVTVFEKHGALAPLGAGILIQPQGSAALDALGVGAAFHAASVPVMRLIGTCHRNWRIVDIDYGQGEARGVSRAALAQLLLDAALALGVQVRYASPVERVVLHGAQAALVTPLGDRLFDLAVIADGAASTLPAQVGLAVASTVYQWGALWAMFDVAEWAGQALLEQRYRGTRQMYGLMPTARVKNKLRLSMLAPVRGAQLPAVQQGAHALLPGRGWRAVARPAVRAGAEAAGHSAADGAQYRCAAQTGEKNSRAGHGGHARGVTGMPLNSLIGEW